MKVYKIIKLYESIPLIVFNLLSYFKFAFKNTKYLAKNQELKNSAQKESCYILMGGMSVNDIDLDRLIGCDVITANNFFRTPDYLRIKPKYHVITDVDFFLNKANLDDLKNKIQDFTSVILNGKHVEPVGKRNWYFIYPLFRVVNSSIKINLASACSNFSTVTLSCIQLAFYIGYKKINLVGFDLPPGRMPHYYKESKSERNALKEYNAKTTEYEYCELFWQYTNCHHEAYKISEYAKRNGFEVYNTSGISCVRAFKFKEFCET